MSKREPYDPFLDTEEAAKYLAISPLTLRDFRYEAAGTGPAFYRFGRKYAYRLSDLNAWASTRRQAS